MFGVHYVEAESAEEARDKVMDDQTPLPDEQNYLDGTFTVDPDEVDEVETILKPMRR
jgi:hypothetical protein